MNKGFTLIEFIITIVIVSILAGFAVISFASFRNNQALSNTVSDAVSIINEAKINTISSKDDSAYGVHFETNRAVLFKGVVFSEPNPDNRSLLFSPLIEISSFSLNGGGTDIIFKKLTGKTDQYGGIIFRVKSDPGNTKTVNITQGGSIDQD